MHERAPDAEAAVSCTDLVVRYGSRVAVDRLSFEAERGSVLVLAGPNGAGKTSTVETLEGYRRPNEGTVRTLGLDPVREHRALVRRMGVMLQRGGVYPTMPARTVVRLFARYYDEAADPDALIDRVGLRPVASTPWRRLSGGEQQRLSLALALVGVPDVVFLDEPTAGVDPEGRLCVRAVLDELRARGACVLLTTHELAEAEHVADRVVVIAHGRKLADATLEELRRERSGNLRFSARPGIDTGALASALVRAQRNPTTGVPGPAVREVTPGKYELDTPSSPALVAALTAWLAARDIALDHLGAGTPSLEEVYLDLVRGAGSGADDEGAHDDGRRADGADR